MLGTHNVYMFKEIYNGLNDGFRIILKFFELITIDGLAILNSTLHISSELYVLWGSNFGHYGNSDIDFIRSICEQFDITIRISTIQTFELHYNEIIYKAIFEPSDEDKERLEDLGINIV